MRARYFEAIILATASAWLAFGQQAAAGGQKPDSAKPPAKTTDPAKRAWTPPRTPWGDPDIEGKWPGTDFVGVPLQRPRNLGARNELTDEEFAARLAAFERQADEDNADFHIDQLTPELVARGTVGGPVSPPPHWLERGKPARQASLI